jgi:photosystem II stability/assembly factor-like uncharacterized protein
MKKIIIFFLFFSFSAGAQIYNWEILPNSREAARHDDIHFLTPSFGWAVNSQGEILKTTDGGTSWKLKFNNLSYFRSVKFTDSLHGFVGTINSNLEDTSTVLYETRNGGDTWDPVKNIPNPRPKGICGLSVSGTTVYGSGAFYGPATVIKSSDNGITWTSINMSNYASTLVDCYFFSPDSGFVVGGSPNSEFNPRNGTTKAVVLFTDNGGKTWQTKFKGTAQPEWGWKIVFPTKKTGYVSIENFSSASILKTTNGGNSWTKINIPELIDLEGIGFINDTNGWVAGRDSEAFTSNGGLTWTTQNIDVGESINRFQFFGDTIGYASGRRIYKYKKKSSVYVHNKKNIVRTFFLSQNYPNPFNPTTTIEYILPEPSKVLIRIYDGLGKEILTLLNSYQTSGKHFVKWNSEDSKGNVLSSGAYIYRIDTDKFSESKMMLFIK